MGSYGLDTVLWSLVLAKKNQDTRIEVCQYCPYAGIPIESDYSMQSDIQATFYVFPATYISLDLDDRVVTYSVRTTSLHLR